MLQLETVALVGTFTCSGRIHCHCHLVNHRASQSGPARGVVPQRRRRSRAGAALTCSTAVTPVVGASFDTAASSADQDAQTGVALKASPQGGPSATTVLTAQCGGGLCGDCQRTGIRAVVSGDRGSRRCSGHERPSDRDTRLAWSAATAADEVAPSGRTLHPPGDVVLDRVVPPKREASNAARALGKRRGTAVELFSRRTTFWKDHRLRRRSASAAACHDAHSS